MAEHDKQFSVPWTDEQERTSRVFIDCYGGGDYVIEVRGELFSFDWSEQFGPMPTRKDGGERLLGPKHKFWRAASLWKLQGMRLEGKRAIWHEPKQPVFEKRGRQSFVVKYGEPGWDW